MMCMAVGGIVTIRAKEALTSARVISSTRCQPDAGKSKTGD